MHNRNILIQESETELCSTKEACSKMRPCSEHEQNGSILRTREHVGTKEACSEQKKHVPNNRSMFRTCSHVRNNKKTQR